jgi:hypothetical protein
VSDPVVTFLDKFFGPPTITKDSVKVPQQTTLEFEGDVAVTDDPANKRTKIVIGLGVRSARVVDADTLLTSSDYHVTVLDHVGGRTITLPADPVAGQEHRIRSRGAPCTINGGGKNIKAAGAAAAGTYVQAAWEEATVLVYVRDDVLGIDEWEVV